MPSRPHQKRKEKYVCDKSHRGKVQVRSIDIQSWWQTHIRPLLVLLNPPIPISVKEREEKKTKLASDVRRVDFEEEAEVVERDVLVDVLLEIFLADFEVLLCEIPSELCVNVVKGRSVSSKRSEWNLLSLE